VKQKKKLISLLSPIIFNENLYSKKVELKGGIDMIAQSATNMYEGVNQKEVEAFYSDKTSPKDPHPISIGLNSKVVKRDEEIIEEIYKSGGLYGKAIDQIIVNLEKAKTYAETDMQRQEIGLLIDFYTSGDLKTWDDFNIVWATDTEPVVDYNNGFIETYGDPLGMKATWKPLSITRIMRLPGVWIL